MGERRVLRSRALELQDTIDRAVQAQIKQQQERLAGFLISSEEEVQPRHMPVRPEVARRYVPIRERSLHAAVRHRAISKRKVSRRWGMR